VKISRIEKAKFRKNAFKIFFEGGGSAAVSADAVVKFSIGIGTDISKEAYREIISYDKSKRAVSDALSLVSKRSYSVKSLEGKLLQRGCGFESAAKALERLKELDYVNDEKYAKAYAAYLSEKGKGEFLIKHELEKQGVDRDLIDEALEAVKDSSDPCEQIVKMLKAKFKDFSGENENEVKKAASFFLRRGFSCENIVKAFKMCARCYDWIDKLNDWRG